MISREKRLRTATTLLGTLSASLFYGAFECKMERGIIVFVRYIPILKIDDLAVELGIEVPPSPRMPPPPRREMIRVPG